MKKHRNTKEWKRPSIIIIASLFLIILVIPSVIVVPFIQSGGNQTKSVDTLATVAEPEKLKDSDSAFSVKVFRTKTEETETVPLEEYVTRVVASEMPAEFEMEALKAQALAARTYIVNYLMYSDIDLPQDSDVTDTVQHQVYKSDEELREQEGTEYNWTINRIKEAVVATKGQIITYEGVPITPAFFSTSNGYTEDSEKYWQNELPYLRSVESSWDLDSPKFLDQKVLTVAQVEQLLGVKIDQSAENVFEIKRTESNRVAEIKLGGKSFTGREIRESLDLRSSDFKVEQKNEHMIFTTKGFGHGVGMSQYGANGMAKEGKNYTEIVTYYYQGAEVAQVDSTAPKLSARN
ncbi:stage II sporulation protein D [Aquibacillus halophilus]|uniref:Stage II sporulation protein D n=2 Tax=Aquibacillus halophilus TaxID=930132 RepID=A0A6A8DRV8_9BACI|nr:stage II sporulation protein D [Aquibacillus halophilus]